MSSDSVGDVSRHPIQRGLAARVFVGSNDGRVYGLDLASGKKVWEYEAASPVTSSPAVAKGKVVVATADGQQREETSHFHSSSMQREADERS